MKIHKIESISRDHEDEINILEKSFANQLKDLLVGKTFISGIDSIEKNTIITYEQLENLSAKTLLSINIRDEKTISDIELRTKNYDIQLGNI